MGGRDSFLIISRVAIDCQARRRKVRIIHHREREYLASFEELNDFLQEQCRRDDVRVVDRQTQSIGQMWQREQPLLRPLPRRPFDCCVTRLVHFTPYSQVVYETNRYSVPVEQARRELVRKRLSVSHRHLGARRGAGTACALLRSPAGCV
jgi:hypothetical protein